MKSNRKIVYFVEGENEKTLIENIKNKYIISGSISVFNVTSKIITSSRIRQYPKNTCIILVFDTDIDTTASLNQLAQNIKILNNANNIGEIVLIPQFKNLEDEIIYATNISNITQLTRSRSKSDFKNDFNKLGNKLIHKLEYFQFDIEKLWSKKPTGKFKKIENQANKIKIK